jgi:hypothetical protein
LRHSNYFWFIDLFHAPKLAVQSKIYFSCFSLKRKIFMPSTVLIKRITGTSGSQTLNDITSGTTRLNTADVVADGTSNPTQIPASGTNYSFWACIRLVCSVAPATEINTIRVYTNGTNTLGTGVGCNASYVAGANGNSTTGYDEASGTAGVTGLEMGANYGSSISTPTSVFTYTSSAPLSLPGQFITGTDTAANGPTGCFADWLILQLTVGSTAAAGVCPAQTITIVWDEF